jgi:N,N-dimethylformamidase
MYDREIHFRDDEGMVYAITTAGDLMWYRHLARAGTPQWANKGIGQRIGWGWSGFTQVVTGGNGYIYAVDPTGLLRWYHHTWSSEGLVPSGSPDLLPEPEWAFDSQGQLVGTGWNNFINVFSGGNGVIYASQPDGTLLWYQHLSRTGENVWANDGEGKPVGAGWNHFSHVFSSGDGIIYAVEANGDLLWYEHLSREGESSWANDGEGQLIGVGWDLPVIEGYCTPITAAPGESIDFRMSTGADAYTVTYMRLKQQADESVGIPMADPFLVIGRLKAAPEAAYETDCDWDADFTLEVPKEWGSGLYAAKCEDTEGFVFYVVFVVKPTPSKQRDFAVLANTNTWTAYNDYGGRSQYTTPNAAILTLERPDPGTSPIDNQQLNHLTRAELLVHNWLEDAGYEFDVYSDLDFHQGIDGLENYKALIAHTHPEYWTSEMMDRLEDFLGQGGGSSTSPEMVSLSEWNTTAKR